MLTPILLIIPMSFVARLIAAHTLAMVHFRIAGSIQFSFGIEGIEYDANRDPGDGHGNGIGFLIGEGNPYHPHFGDGYGTGTGDGYQPGDTYPNYGA